MTAQYYIRLSCLVVMILIGLWSYQKKKQLNCLILAYLGASFLGEIVPFFVPRNNIVIYSVLQVLDMSILTYLVFTETRQKWLTSIVFLFACGALLFFYATDLSSYELLYQGFEPSYNLLLTVHQYFDFTSIHHLALIVLMLSWLIYVAKGDTLDLKSAYKKYLVIFSFLLYFGGTFFVLAFGRILTTDGAAFHALLEVTLHPLGFLLYILLFISIQWKRIN